MWQFTSYRQYKGLDTLLYVHFSEFLPDCMSNHFILITFVLALVQR